MTPRPRFNRLAIAAIVVGLSSLAFTSRATVAAHAIDRHVLGPASVADVVGSEGLRDLDHRLWTPDDLRGRLVVADAWATWCAPCLAELPRLRALTERHGDRLVVLGLSLDTMPRRDFVSWLRRHDVGWPQVFDGRGYGGPAATRLGIETLPASWLFDQEGRLVATGLRGDHLDRVVGALIGRPDGTIPGDRP